MACARNYYIPDLTQYKFSNKYSIAAYMIIYSFIYLRAKCAPRRNSLIFYQFKINVLYSNICMHVYLLDSGCSYHMQQHILFKNTKADYNCRNTHNSYCLTLDSWRS